MALINRAFGCRRQLDPELAERLTPGQYVVKDFPVLSLSPTPRTRPEDWTLRTDGAREMPRVWTWDESTHLLRVAGALLELGHGRATRTERFGATGAQIRLLAA